MKNPWRSRLGQSNDVCQRDGVLCVLYCRGLGVLIIVLNQR
jgi:hypothetical protein